MKLGCLINNKLNLITDFYSVFNCLLGSVQPLTSKLLVFLESLCINKDTSSADTFSSNVVEKIRQMLLSNQQKVNAANEEVSMP